MDLPREIRNQIWAHALPNARLIRATVEDGSWVQTFDYHPIGNSAPHFIEVPALLHAI
jgi:hypothetical protein